MTVNRVGRRVHIYIGHGESGKATSGYRTGSLYDSIFVAHYSAVGRFPRVIRRWVWSGACAIGTVLVEGVRKDPWTRPRPVRTILYAPTWESYSVRGDFTSLDVVGPLLTEALPALAERGSGSSCGRIPPPGFDARSCATSVTPSTRRVPNPVSERRRPSNARTSSSATYPA